MEQRRNVLFQKKGQFLRGFWGFFGKKMKVKNKKYKKKFKKMKIEKRFRKNGFFCENPRKKGTFL